MRILIVDDDDNKVAQVEGHVREICVEDEIQVRRSFQSGLKEILLGHADLILLDMTMPTYDVTEREPGGRERRYAGREILRQMSRRGKHVPTVVITQYEQFEENGKEITLAELSATLRREFPHAYVATVYYQASGNDWMRELGHFIELIRGKSRNDI